MSDTGAVYRHEVYPKRYFDQSQTWFAWNKLTVKDIYTLSEEKGFEGQNVFFWLNHPIQFVRLVGMIVQLDLVANGKYALLTLDDFSGANIELKVERRQLIFGGDAEFPSNTMIDSVDVDVNLGEATARLDKKPLEMGSIVMARGTITKFAQQRQILLQRLSAVRDTRQEATCWNEVAIWKTKVLSSPWILTEQARRETDEKIARTTEEERKYVQKRRKHAERRAKKEKRHEEKQALLEKSYNADAIPGSNLLADYSGLHYR